MMIRIFHDVVYLSFVYSKSVYWPNKILGTQKTNMRKVIRIMVCLLLTAYWYYHIDILWVCRIMRRCIFLLLHCLIRIDLNAIHMVIYKYITHKYMVNVPCKRCTAYVNILFDDLAYCRIESKREKEGREKKRKTHERGVNEEKHIISETMWIREWKRVKRNVHLVMVRVLELECGRVCKYKSRDGAGGYQYVFICLQECACRCFRVSMQESAWLNRKDTPRSSSVLNCIWSACSKEGAIPNFNEPLFLFWWFSMDNVALAQYGANM